MTIGQKIYKLISKITDKYENVVDKEWIFRLLTLKHEMQFLNDAQILDKFLNIIEYMSKYAPGLLENVKKQLRIINHLNNKGLKIEALYLLQNLSV